MSYFIKIGRFCGLLLAGLSLSAGAQTLVFTNGVQTYATLTSTTVTLSNRCELRVTAATAPLTGCIINLNSSDAWLLLTGIKPSVAVSTYLGQVRVNGAAAVADSNVRVVQYGAGAAIIPQAPAFQPLQVFSGPNFTGVSASYSQYVYYTGTALGTLDMNISSFKLKRGYMVVVALNTTGSANSKCYVAQDGDLEISVLPGALDNKIRFIYVTPWRWVNKKGIAGNIEGPLNVAWKYNWNLDQNSTRDMEYVPIRQLRWWPSLAQNWQTIGANTVLGYNEPDSTAQANIAVGDAIWSWPDLLGTGLRVGSPAPSDGGRSSWLYPFMTQADAAGLRVDFVAVHYYWCYDPTSPSGAATQMYNFLKATYDQVKRPLWVTEWNQGANWTGCTDPTYAQQQAAVGAMIDMLESTPFVERYSIYNWVEDVRRVEWDDGSLTDAGVTYRDKVSTLSYRQTLPDNGTRSLAQFQFETNVWDSSGYGNNGLAVGAPAYVAGHSGKAVLLDGTNSYIQLPPNIAASNSFSFAAWVNWSGGANWQRIFDFGSDTTHYLFLTPNSGSGTLRFAIKNGGSEQIVETAGLPSNQWQHVCITLSGTTGKIYTNGVLAVTSTSFSITPASFTPMFNYFGKSQFPADPLFGGSLDEVQVADYALTAAQVAALVTNNPPQFSANFLPRGTAAESVAFTTNITGTATDPDPGDTLTYSKAVGPAWLTVGAGGLLTGTPGAADGGTNYFTVRATDAAGASASALVAIYVPLVVNNGTWNTNADGLWSDTNNWTGGAVANGIGYAADFSTLDLLSNLTVTLDTSRSLGTLKFADLSGTQSWNLKAGDGVVLTLDTGSATSPSLVVGQGSVTNTAPLAGGNGFTKSGTGTLVLAVDSSLAGTLYVDSGSGTANDGAVRVASPGALAGITNISLRNNTGGSASSTLQLADTLGNVTVTAPLGLAGRNANVAAIQNISGTNTVTGTTTLNAGGAYYIVQSDAGQLTLAGTLTAAATGSRTLTVQGAGDTLISGTIINGAATNNLTKLGTGNLTLSGANLHSGTNRIAAGKLMLANPAALALSLVDMNASDAGTLSFGTLSSATVGGLIGSRGLGLTNSPGTDFSLRVGGNGPSLTYAGSLSGYGNLIKINANTQTLAGVSTFTGTTRVNAGTLALGTSVALQKSTVNLDAADYGALSFGTLASAVLGGLTGVRDLALTNNLNAAVTLNVGGGGQNQVYAGVLSGPGSLVKSGAGVLTLSSSNRYTGSTTISGGTLKLSRDPVAKFTFDNVGGTALGSVVTNAGSGGTDLNAVVTGGSVSYAGGKVGNALSLSASGAYLKITNRVINTDAAGTWTVGFWVKTTTAGAMVLYQGDGAWSSSGQTTFLLNANSGTTAGTKAGAVRWAGGFLTGTRALNDGAWHFITIVDNAGTESIYVDGVVDGVTSAMSLALASGANQTWIGNAPDTDTGAVKMTGLIDEVYLFNRALSQTEIQKLTNNVTAVTAGNFGGQLPAGTTLAVGSGATLDLGGNSQVAGLLSDIGGAGGTITNSGAAAAVFTFGAGASGSFSGVIADQDATNAIALVKAGAGTETLAGASTYRGPTVVNAGTLLVNGQLGAGVVTVAANATLGGNGIIPGAVTLLSGATLAPGNANMGALAISNSLTLANNSVTLIEIGKTGGVTTNDAVVGLTSLVCGGTLTVNNIGSDALAAGDTFPIFAAAVYQGAFAVTNLPPLDSPLYWTNRLAVDGTLAVVSPVSTTATALVWDASGTNLMLSWPADHTGWRLVMQTNHLGLGLSSDTNDWMTVPGSPATNLIQLLIDPTLPGGYYRLVWP